MARLLEPNQTDKRRFPVTVTTVSWLHYRSVIPVEPNSTFVLSMFTQYAYMVTNNKY